MEGITEHWFYKMLQQDINRTDKKSDRYRDTFYFTRVLLIVIGSLVTITSGWHPDIKSQPDVLHFLLILGAITTGATAVDTLFQVETKKNVYKLMLVELREIRSEFEQHYNTGDKTIPAAKLDDLSLRRQKIIAYSKTLINKEEDQG